MYNVLIRRQAKKKLLSLPNSARINIVEHIHRLSLDPRSGELDIKKMRGVSLYRLRVGQWRILFDCDDKLKIISIEKLGARGDVYK